MAGFDIGDVEPSSSATTY